MLWESFGTRTIQGTLGVYIRVLKGDNGVPFAESKGIFVRNSLSSYSRKKAEHTCTLCASFENRGSSVHLNFMQSSLQGSTERPHISNYTMGVGTGCAKCCSAPSFN